MNIDLELKTDGGDVLKSYKDLRAELAAVAQEEQALNKAIKDRAEVVSATESTVAKALISSNQQMQKAKDTLDTIKKTYQDNAKVAGEAFKADPVIKYTSSIKEANDLLKQLQATGGKGILSKQEVSKLTVDLINAKDEFAALGVILDTTKKKIADLDPNSEEFKGMSAAIGSAEAMLKGMNDETDDATDKQKSLKVQLREMTQQLAQLKVEGKENTEEYTILKAKADELADTLADAREEIKQSGSDTKGFDQLIRTASTVTASFQIAQGAAAIFGQDNEDLQKSLLKVNAAMSILNGLQAIQSELTKKDSVIRGAAIAVQKAWTLAIEETNVALRLTKAALLATGIGAAIIIIGYLITHFDDLKESLSDFLGVSEDQIKTQQALNDINSKAIDKYVQEIAAIEALGKQYADTNITRERQKQIIEELQSKEPAYFNSLKTEGESIERVTAAVKRYIEVRKLQAQVQAAYELYVEKQKDLLKKEQESVTDNISTWDELWIHLISGGSKAFILQKEIQTGTENQAKAVKKLADEAQRFFNLYLNFSGQVEKTGINDPARAKKELEEKKKQNDALLAAAKEGSKSELDLKKQSILLQRDIDLQQTGLTDADKKLIKAKSNKELYDLDKAFNKQQKELSIQFIDDLHQLVSGGAKDRLETIKNSYDREKEQLKMDTAEELYTVEEAYKKILASQRLSAKQKAELKEAYNNRILDIQNTFSSKYAQIDSNALQDRIKATREANIIILQLHGLQKEAEIKGLDDKYDDLRKKLQAAGKLTNQEETKLFEAKEKEKKGIIQKYGQQDLDKQEELEIAKINIITDSRYSPAALEEIKQKKVLEVQLLYAKKRLEALKAAGGSENQVAIAQAQTLVTKLQSQIKEGEVKGNNLNSWFAHQLGISEGELKNLEDKLKGSISDVVNIITEGIQQKIDLKQQEIDALNSKISEQESDLDREIQLHKQGYAANVEGKRKELDDLKKQRDKDIADQRAYQKQLAIIEAAKQGSILATSIANMVLTTSKIFESMTEEFGWVGALLAVAEAGAVVAEFFALRAQIKQVQSFGDGGIVGGKKHSQGGNKYVSMDGNDPSIVEIEAGEHLTNAESTKKYGALLSAINSDELSKMTYDDIMQLISPTDVRMKDNLAKKVVTMVNQVNEIQLGSAGSSSDDQHLREIAATNAQLLEMEKNREDRIEMPDKTIIKKGNHTRIINK